MRVGPILSGAAKLIGYSATATVLTIGAIIVLYNTVPPFRRLFERRVLFALHAKMMRGPWADNPAFYVYYPPTLHPAAIAGASASIPSSSAAAVKTRASEGAVLESPSLDPVDAAGYLYFAAEQRSGGAAAGGRRLTAAGKKWRQHHTKGHDRKEANRAVHLMPSHVAAAVGDLDDEVPLLIPA